MSLLLNLRLAEAAVAYTKQKFWDGASNLPQDIAHSALYRGGSLTENSTELNFSEFDSLFGTYYKKKGEREFASALAKWGAEVGQGNCGEQSTMAFDYLRKKARWVRLARVAVGEDHAFVILNPPFRLFLKPSFNIAITSGRGSSMDNWPEDCVVCDPWYYEWFGVRQDGPRKLRSILKATQNGRVGMGFSRRIDSSQVVEGHTVDFLVLDTHPQYFRR